MGRIRFRQQLLTYADVVVSDEWDAMARGVESQKARQEYNKLWETYLEIRPRNLNDLASELETPRRMNELGENRNQRLLYSKVTVHPMLWFALIVVGAMIIAFGYFFGTRKLGAQILMTAFLSGTLALIVVVIVVLSHPFKGQGRISPEPFNPDARPAPLPCSGDVSRRQR